MTQEYFTVTEAADLLRLSRGYLYNLLSRGGLQAERIGRARRIPQAEILRLLSGNGNGQGWTGDESLRDTLLRISGTISKLFPGESEELARLARRPYLHLVEADK